MRNIRWISDFCKKIWVLTLTRVEARQRGSHAGEVGGRASVGTHASEGMLAPAKLPRWRATVEVMYGVIGCIAFIIACVR